MRAAVSRRLADYERRDLRPPDRLAHPPLFVISLPQSGSTLLCQLLLQRFRLAYFSNLMAAFADSPVTVARLTRWLGGQRPPKDLRNHFGTTRGWRGPNEGWRIWDRWLAQAQDFIDPATLDPRAVAEMRATLHELQVAQRAPFISEWQRHAPRLRALGAAFPEALFVHLRRAPEMTAQAILAGRRRLLRDETAWLSARPRDYGRIRMLEPLEQVCAQVVGLERDLREDEELIGIDRFMFVSYEALCLAPLAVLDGVAEWYRERTGSPLTLRRELGMSIDEQYQLSVPPAEFERIRSVLERMYAAGAPA